MQHIDEPELIARALDADSGAYGQLVDRYKQAIFHHCFAILHDEDAAEDMAQEAFIAAFYQLKKYDQTYKFSTWLFRVSTNKCLNYLRHSAKVLPADEHLVDQIVSTQLTPHEQAEADELRRAVSRLQPNYRAVISLHYWQGLEYADIAMVMGAPLNSIRVWLSRAKQQLRKDLS